MGVQTYKPRDLQDILEVENATSRRRTDCGADFRPFGGSGVSTIWLDVEESSAAVMADLSRESANASSSQQASPIQSSPLQSSSSQSSHEATQRTSQERLQPPLDASGPGARANTSRISLVETLQTCLTSRPSSATASGLPSAEGRSSLSDPGGAAPPTLRESRTGSMSKALAPKKPSKRRSRASRRVPTTVLEASSSDFRDMVQRLTGIPANSPAPVRPLPQRASPATFIRPDRPLPAAPVSRPAPYSTSGNSPALDFMTPRTPPASTSARFDEFPPPWHRTSSELVAPLRSSMNVRRELSSVTPYSMPGSIITTRPLRGPTSSWGDSAAHDQARQISLPASSLAIIATSGPPNPVSSSAGLIFLPEENELSMSQLDDWLAGDDH